MSEYIKTQLIAYSYNMNNENDKKEYNEKIKPIFSDRTMNSISTDNSRNEIVSGEVYLETKYIFSNQWNTASNSPVNANFRVFDHYEEYQIHNKKIKRGHYLVITDEIKELRRNTYSCGYCGHQEPAAKGNIFHDCYDSQYLKESNLNLLRMQSIDNDKSRSELNESEKSILLPLYIEAQTKASTERQKKAIEKKRIEIKNDYEKAIQNAKNEFDGFTWLMDNNINLDNVIYYNHTQKFCFGWRYKLDDGVKSELLDLLCEFNFDYEFAKDDK